MSRIFEKAKMHMEHAEESFEKVEDELGEGMRKLHRKADGLV
jgi:hypothetical protein